MVDLSSPTRDNAGGVLLADLGEAAIIELLTQRAPEVAGAVVGNGDDAGVVDLSSCAVTTDMAVQGHDFRTDWSHAADVGWKVVVQNVADVVAMGATPAALLMAFGAPSATSASWVEGFGAGFGEACRHYGVGLLGGDVSAAAQIVVSVTAFGEVSGVPVRRRGACVGDDVVVAGLADPRRGLGLSALGLRLLGDGVPRAQIPRAALGAHVRPAPELLVAGQSLWGVARAMLDLSDGLVKDVGRVAAASGVRVDLDGGMVDRHAAALVEWWPALGARDARALVLSGGEEHVLIACVPRDARCAPGWSRVGRVVDGGPGVTVDGAAIEGAGGFDHFR